MFFLQKLLKWKHLFAIIVSTNISYELYSSDENPKKPIFYPDESKNLKINSLTPSYENAKKYQKKLAKRILKQIVTGGISEQEKEQKHKKKQIFKKRALLRIFTEKLKTEESPKTEEI